MLNLLKKMLSIGTPEQNLQTRIVYDTIFVNIKDTKFFNKHPIHVFKCDDNSICVEWRFRNLIMSINIEEDVRDSSWSLTSREEIGNYSMGGYFDSYYSIFETLELCLKIIIDHKEDLDKIIDS